MLSMRHAPRTLPRGGREAVHTSGIRPQAAKRTQRIHAHGRHPPFHEKMRKWIAPPSSKNSETVSDTMYHAIPRRTASREIDAVHPLGPTRVHPIHPTRPCTGQCARHGHVDHHTRFDRRPKAKTKGLQFLRPPRPQNKNKQDMKRTAEALARPQQATSISTHESPWQKDPRPGALPPVQYVHTNTSHPRGRNRNSKLQQLQKSGLPILGRRGGAHQNQPQHTSRTNHGAKPRLHTNQATQQPWKDVLVRQRH